MGFNVSISRLETWVFNERKQDLDKITLFKTKLFFFNYDMAVSRFYNRYKGDAYQKG